ncbi:unnamed protein product [Thlaspi arvense]|uniref:Eukaryotic translation initiation factor 5A n=1 Tax=Thlaspi arvense TaxID=13288 RepID=A0AAU9RVQ4_THLAR|nr:unnamed protein product [Thlaspi arvense]
MEELESSNVGDIKTYSQKASTIRKNGYIVIKSRPCKVVEVSTSETNEHGHANCHFVAIDIFTSEKHEDTVPTSHICDVRHVPRVNQTHYPLLDISEDGFVSVLTENGTTKDDLKLPTEEPLLTQVTFLLKAGFEEEKDIVIFVMSVMGEERIFALEEVGTKGALSA